MISNQRDIKTILNKVVKEKESEESISVSLQAYKLFSDGKDPIYVAIALNLRKTKVAQYYKEYCKLKQLYDFNRLYRLAKAAGMNPKNVVNLLTIANNYLPAVEQRYEKLKREEASLKAGNHNSARTFQELSDLISTTHSTLEQYESDCEEKRLEITKLQIQRIGAEALVKDFKVSEE